MDRLQVAADRVRDLVNEPRLKAILMSKRQNWLGLCGAMDAIGDTQLAVLEYLNNPLEDGASEGWKYLVVYGILQALYVQQDSVERIAAVVGAPYARPVQIDDIRDIRNDAIGHPAGGGGFVSRITLSAEGFQLLVPIKGKKGLVSVSIPDLARLQTDLLGQCLEAIAQHLITDELEHRKKFKGESLSALFNPCGYAIEKIADGMDRKQEIPMGLGGADSIKGVITEFEARLEERGLTDAYADSVGRNVASVRHVLQRCEERLNGQRLDWKKQDCDIHWRQLNASLDELRGHAAYLDELYASDQV
jgi:hypothetical protein